MGLDQFTQLQDAYEVPKGRVCLTLHREDGSGDEYFLLPDLHSSTLAEIAAEVCRAESCDGTLWRSLTAPDDEQSASRTLADVRRTGAWRWQ